MVRDSTVARSRSTKRGFFSSHEDYSVPEPVKRNSDLLLDFAPQDVARAEGRQSGLMWDLEEPSSSWVLEEQNAGDRDDQTLASFLMRGNSRTTVTAHHSHASHGSSMHLLKSSSAKLSSAVSRWTDEIPLQYITDPPLFIAEHSDMQEPPKGSVVHRYWKEHASWLKEWPAIADACDHIAKVKAVWHDMLADIHDADNVYDQPQRDPVRMFVHMGRKPMAVRSKPTQELGAAAEVVRPGEIIVSDLAEEIGGVQYYRIAGRPADKPGWVFDSIGGETIMAEMKNVDTTPVWYRAIAAGKIFLHKVPSYHRATMNGLILGTKEVFVVDLRCRVGAQDYVHLADGRGWIYERVKRKDSVVEIKTPTSRKDFKAAQYVAVVGECEEEMLSSGSGGLRHRMSDVPSTTDIVKTGMWTYIVGESPVLVIGDGPQGSLLQPGEEIKVDKKCTANGDLFVKGSGVLGRQWFRLHGKERRGWVPATAVNGKQLLFEKEEQSAYPSWGTSARESVDATEDWMIGTV